MLTYILRRTIQSVLVIIGVSLLTFIAVESAPGDVIDAMLPPESQTSDEARERLREELGLNAPAPVRYVRWLGNMATGNLGYSFASKQPVSHMILNRLPSTLLLVGFALVFSTVVGIALGFVAAIKRFTWIDTAATLISFVWLSVPSFFLGLALIYLVSVRLGWLPGFGSSSHDASNPLVDRALHLILPGITLGMDLTAALLRFVRASMIDVLQQDYLRTARAKGLRNSDVLMRHAFRNALNPIITIIAFRLPFLIGGAVIVESVFQWPGIGTMTINAATSKDYPVLMAVGVVVTLVAVVSNLMADVAYGLIDPRVKYS